MKNKGVFRTAPATPGLLKRCSVFFYKKEGVLRHFTFFGGNSGRERGKSGGEKGEF